MKTIAKLFAVSFISTSIVGCAGMGGQNSATPLELRMMQTRQFNKPPREIVDAIKTNCEDYGGNAMMTMPFNITDSKSTGTISGKNQKVVNKDMSLNGTGVCQLPMKWDGTAGGAAFIPYIGGLIAMAELNNAMKSASQMKYDVKTDPKMTTTTVRMRIYSMKNEQMTDPKIYSEWFAKIGDAVHLQAIEISPSTQE